MPGVVVQMWRRPRDHAAGSGIRYGLTASRRVGKAVERNRARRRLRAAAEQVLPLHGTAGCDYVLIGRMATLTRPYDALLADVRRAVERLSRDRRRGDDRHPGSGHKCD